MMDQPLEFLETVHRYWNIAATAIDNSAMTVAIIITAAILAAVGGMVGMRMRLYGAIVGGMIMNVVVKAMGGGFAAALAAMAVTTVLAFAVGSTPFLLQVLKRARRPRG